MQIFKFQRCSYKLSSLFLLRRQSALESLLQAKLQSQTKQKNGKWKQSNEDGQETGKKRNICYVG